MAFFGGSTGAIYRQFSLTIVSAMALSVLVALILTPALCATLLKSPGEHHEPKGGFFGWFNALFDRSVAHYSNSVSHILRKTGRYLVVYVLIVGGYGGAVPAPADLVPAGRRPGCFHDHGAAPGGRYTNPYPAGAGSG
ncbi:Acriflavine resistance protein B [Leclercia adecarboxylata]|uniref:Acriflavine resistance protein B n=1 Tax=Leclercia adecarboxylata TaxID=83655 RepID=A0A4U9ISA3_9ENTR|nr:Acriflavine resistance protein B [Leclercia adecarboxylata]